MSEFEIKKLGDVIELVIDNRGRNPKSYESEGIPVIDNYLITSDGEANLEAVNRFIDEETYTTFLRKYVQEGDVLMTLVGNGYGKVATTPAKQCAIIQNTIGLRCGEKYDNQFLYYLLRNNRDALMNLNRGAAQPSIKVGDILDLELKFPPLKEQNRIAKALKSLDDKIQLNRQTNQTLEQIAQAIFKSWFVDFDPVKAKIAAKQAGASAEEIERAAMCAISGIDTRDPAAAQTQLQKLAPEVLEQLKATAGLFPDALVDAAQGSANVAGAGSAGATSELGLVPEGWEYKKLKDICRVLNGRAYKNSEFKEDGTPIVRIQNLSRGGKGGKTVYSDMVLPLDKLIYKEDFIYAWSATFGPHIWRGPKSIYHYHIWKMDVDETVVSRYFMYLSMFRKTEQMKSGATGSIFTHLTKGIMERQDILIASPELNTAFKSMLENIFAKVTKLNEEIDSLTEIRDTLLPKLLSGELSPSQSAETTEEVA